MGHAVQIFLKSSDDNKYRTVLGKPSMYFSKLNEVY